MRDSATEKQLLELTANIVSAHVANNATQTDALPGLIKAVYASLAGIGVEPEVPVRPEPAVAIKRSVFDDYIICLEDGKKLKMLKRHLASSYGLTPQGYRERWNLPPDYPMVAPNYAKHRSSLAKQIGLGRKPSEPAAAPAPVAAAKSGSGAKAAVAAKKVPGKRGRKKATA